MYSDYAWRAEGRMEQRRRKVHYLRYRARGVASVRKYAALRLHTPIRGKRRFRLTEMFLRGRRGGCIIEDWDGESHWRRFEGHSFTGLVASCRSDLG